MATFIWTAWNREHVRKHGVTISEAAYVVANARPPYPEYMGDEKFLVRGQKRAGRYIQVIYVMESEADIDYAEVDVTELDPNEEAFYVIHARPLTPAERHNYKQRRSR